MEGITVWNPKDGNKYVINVLRSGENHMACPVCSTDRKKKNAKCFSYNVLKAVGHCSHCNVSLMLHREIENKAISKPIKPLSGFNGTKVSDKVLSWLKSRGIGQKTVVSMRLSEGMEFMPQVGKKVNTVQFNYFLENELINVKYRDGAKNFKMVKDAGIIFYNLDAVKQAKEIVIVEGEMDCLSMIEAGVTNCISVPNGAVKGSNNMQYLDHAIDMFDPDVKFVLALDNDSAGNVLRDEFIRRLGAENCFVVSFNDCKDANEFLMKYGSQALYDAVENKKDIPLQGVFTAKNIDAEIDDYYHNGLPKGCRIGVSDVDRLISFHEGYLSLITGIPGMGKSEVVDWLCCKLNVLYGWKVAFYSPENYPLQLHFSKIAEKLIGKRFEGYNKMNYSELTLVKKYFDDNFYFIKPEEDFTLDSILDTVRQLVRRKGVKLFVIDAWNKLEHKFTTNETQYISHELDKLSMFCEKNRVHLFLVAHPTKIQKKKDGIEYEMPTLYSVSGSAAFYNKCSLGLVIHRDSQTSQTILSVQKVKFKHWGENGECRLAWNRENGRYNSVNHYDDANWLIKEQIQTNFYEKIEELGDAPY